MSRTLTTAQRAAIAGLEPKCWVRFRITDSTGAFVDVSTGLRNIDWLNAVTISDDIDANAASMSGNLLRESGTLSLAPFRSDSLINLPGGSYATMLDLWRRWDCFVSVKGPTENPPTGTDWKGVSEGRIDIIDTGGDDIKIQGRSEEAVLLDCWIQGEKQYGSVGGIAMETVIQSMLDDNLGAGVVTLFTPVSPGYLMNTWTQQKGSLMVAIQDVASKAGFKVRYRYSASDVFQLTLFKPDRTASSELWAIGPSEYTAVPLNKIDISGVRNFIKLRYVHPTLGTQTVIYPHMAGTGTLAVTAGVGVFSSSQAGIVRADSRTNVIVNGISYSISGFNGTTGCTVSSQLASGGVPTFAASAFTLHDTPSGAGLTTSLTRFGRRDMEIDLSFTTQVNDPTKAQGMADAVGPDMEFPNLEQQFEGIGWWFMQLHDYGKFLANGVHYDSDQFGAVSSLSVNFANATARWTIGARGKPAGAYTGWRMLGAATAPSGPIAQQALRDTKPIQLKVVRQSESASQIVSRVYAISAVAGASVSLSYDNGGLTVTPASPQTLVATTDFATTTFVDFTITRDTQGGTPRRVAFAGDAPGYVTGTDGVDVVPNSTRERCKVFNSLAQSIGSASFVLLTWDSEVYDTGPIHDTSTNPGRIVIPTGGASGVWAFCGQVSFNGNSTGDRAVELRKNGTPIGATAVRARADAGNATIINVFALDDAPTVGGFYEVYARQDTGGALNIVSGSGNSFFSAVHLW